MTPGELETLLERGAERAAERAVRLVADEKAHTEAPPSPPNGKLKSRVELVVTILGALAAAGVVVAYLFMPRVEAAQEDQKVKDLVSTERTINLVQEQQLIVLDKNLSEMREDVKSIGRRVGAKVK